VVMDDPGVICGPGIMESSRVNSRKLEMINLKVQKIFSARP
jgi:hypothetical protein